MGRACGGGHKIHPRHGGGCLGRLSAGRRGGGETGAEAGHDDSDECRGRDAEWSSAWRCEKADEEDDEGSSGRGEREDRGPGSVLNFSTIPEAVLGDHKLRFIAEPAPPLHGLSYAYVSTLQLLFTFSPVMEFRPRKCAAAEVEAAIRRRRVLRYLGPCFRWREERIRKLRIRWRLDIFLWY